MTATDPQKWADWSDEKLAAIPKREFDAVTGDIAALLSEGALTIELEQPSEELWDAIAVALRHAETPTIDVERHLAPVQPLERRRDAEPEPAFQAESRWSGFTVGLTLVAACILLVLVPIGLSMRSDDNSLNVIAAADLDVLDPAATEGHADLVVDQDHELIELDLSATAPTDDYLELWLLAFDDDGGIADMISLGAVDGDGSYVIPDGVDTGRFNTVDISIEADDGDATHSGRSVLRGQFLT